MQVLQVSFALQVLHVIRPPQPSLI